MSTSPAPSQAPTAANPIARAAQLLREGAQELKEYGWTAEPEAKAVYDEYLAVAAALDAFQYEKPLAGAMTAAAMPSDDEVDAVLKLCGWLSETRHDAERQRQIRCSFRRTIHEAFRLGVEAARRPQPEPHTDMPDFWSVDVHVDAERLVSIGHNWLSGKELGQAEERAIIGAAQHLLAFVGFGLPRPDFDPDADEAAAHGAVTGELAAHQPSASSAAARPSAELADYHGPDDTPHPVLLALSEHDNPCEDTEEALARIAALRTEIESLRPYLQRAQARAEAQAGNVEATVQASPGYPLLAKKHTGSRVNYRGLLGQCQSILRRHGGGGYAEILRQLEGHIKQLGERWYAGDTAVVDEMLQLYCVESQLREALSLNFAEHKGDVALLESPAAAPAVPWPIAPDVADELERSDWTPEEALRWYAAGRHYDTVPNGDGTSSARILDNGEVASNALRAYDDQALTGEAPGRHLAEHILGMDFVTDRGLRARELARKVLSQDYAALAAPTSEQAGAAEDAPMLDHFARVMVVNSHHYTSENIRALVVKYRAIEHGDPDALLRLEHEDWRAEAGVLHRIIAGLAEEVPCQGGDWLKAAEQLPPCRNDERYIGINSAGFAGIFNAVADIAGNVHCMMETPEESISIMSDLALWCRFSAPASSGAAPAAEGDALSQAARDVLAERQRQISVEGWTPEHDDAHNDGSLARAAAAYAAQSLAAEDTELECGPPPWWPWERSGWKPTSRRRMLEKAGALIQAEMERLDRAVTRAQAKERGV